MDMTLAQILTELYQQSLRVDQLTARVAELEAELKAARTPQLEKERT